MAENKQDTGIHGNRGTAAEIDEGCPAETAMAGHAPVCRGCPGRGLCQAQGGPDPDQDLIDLRMNAVRHKIIVLSGKGGVGKSSISCNLARVLVSKSAKVGVLDLDICGPSLPKMFGVDGQSVISSQYGWKPLISADGVKVMSVGCLLSSKSQAVTFRGPRKTNLIKRFLKDTFWGRLDYLIFDTPPGTSDEHLSVVRYLKSTKPDGVVIVTTPQDVAIATIKKEIDFCKKLNLNILGVIENMGNFCCPYCGETSEIFEGKDTRKLWSQHNIECLGKVPLMQEITQSGEEGTKLEDKSHVVKYFDEIIENLNSVLYSN